jgi:DNA-binding GntR family transcriptional regulator
MTEIAQRTMTEQVLAQIRHLILSGALEPGSKINQADLAQRFATSLVPVREALARLQSSGLVQIVPHRGAFVAGLSLEEMVDIYTMREVLEEQAAQEAARRFTDNDISMIEALVNQIEIASSTEAFDTFLRLNRDLHFTIYRAAGRRHLLQVIEQLWKQSERYRRLQIHRIPQRVEASLSENQLILAACHQRDAESLGSIVRYKVHQTKVGLLEIMQPSSSQ